MYGGLDFTEEGPEGEGDYDGLLLVCCWLLASVCVCVSVWVLRATKTPPLFFFFWGGKVPAVTQF